MTPPRRTIARVPGKIILAGEHAAVYGRPALVAAFGPGVNASLESVSAAQGDLGVAAASTLRIELQLEATRTEVDLPWSEALRLGERVRRAWEEFAAGSAPFLPLRDLTAVSEPVESSFQRMRREALAFVQVALAESWWSSVGRSPVGTPPPMVLRIESALPLGAGCGSSAAVAAAVAMVVRAHFDPAAEDTARATSCGAEFEPSKTSGLEALVQTIESRQHGHPSGIDGATVLRGGVVFAWRHPIDSAHWDFQPIGDPQRLLAGVRIVLTGGRPESTGEVVAAVRRLYRNRRSLVEAALTELAEATTGLRTALALGAAEDFARQINRCQAGLESLGVVPEPVSRWIAGCRDLGLAAKISGAGSSLGPAAGLVLLYDPKAAADRAIRDAGYSELPGRLGGEGARIERGV
jgi:mevalonate kinase